MKPYCTTSKLQRYGLPSLGGQISLILIAVWLLLSGKPVYASDDKTDLSFQSCSAVANEMLTTTQLYQRGIPLNELLPSLPDISPKGQQRVRDLYQRLETEGITSVYSKINSSYSQCAKQTYKELGMPAADSRDYGYYFCAGENKIRYEIALAIYLQAEQEAVIAQLQEQHKVIGRHYYALAKVEGIDAVFDLIASGHKNCLNQIYITTPH